MSEDHIIGWREWVQLPELGIDFVKAKVDTGARTSSLHAFDLQFEKRGQKEFVHFKVYLEQRSRQNSAQCRAEVIDYRSIKSSNGISTRRPVISTTIKLLDQSWPVELTLSSRDEMGFRMLLGREAFRRRLLVDAGKSYYSIKPKRNKAKDSKKSKTKKSKSK